jgi:putative membrane protein insertion efficiency factor
VISRLLQGLVKLYRYTLSPFWGAQCRFHPTCSCYAIEALQKHGSIKGTGLAIYRILRCNPWAKGGVDPVPEKTVKK